MDWPEIEAAALSRNDRFLGEVVEGLGVCPYAKPGRLAGTTRRVVLPDATSTMRPLRVTDRLREAYTEIAADPGVEVMQVIFPRSAAGPREWVRSAKEVTASLQAGLERSVVGVAAFHPALDFKTTSPAAMVPLFRRSPDPMIQWVRLDALERVRRGRPNGDVMLPSDDDGAAELKKQGARVPLEEHIAASNFRLAHSVGLDGFEALLASLAES